MKKSFCDKTTDEKFFAQIENYKNRETEYKLKLLPFFKDLNSDLSKTINCEFLRGLSILKHCMINIYSIRKPSSDYRLEADDVANIEINLQSFRINLYGVLENLASIYAKISNFDSKYQSNITFFKNKKKKNKLFSKLPQDIKNLFYPEWMAHIKEIRNSLAHGKPPYIPYGSLDSKKTMFEELEDQKNICVINMLMMCEERRKNGDDVLATLEMIEKEDKKIEEIEIRQKEECMVFVPIAVVTNVKKNKVTNKELMFYEQMIVDSMILFQISDAIIDHCLEIKKLHS